MGNKNNELQNIVIKGYDKKNQLLQLTQKAFKLPNLQKQWEQITKCNQLKDIEQLYLGDCSINNNNIKVIFPHSFPHLRKINLSFNQKLECGGIKLFVKCDLPQLLQLRLSYCRVGEQGSKHLIKGDWKNLEFLGLHSNEIKRGGCEYIYNGHWRNLQQLILSEEDATNIINIILIEGEKVLFTPFSFNNQLRLNLSKIVTNRFNLLR